jgi:hypothetical protein
LALDTDSDGLTSENALCVARRQSFGADAVITAHEPESVRAVPSAGAPYAPAHVEHNHHALVERILAELEALADRPHRRHRERLLQDD